MLPWSTGVKNADENELRSIASDPDEIHMYNVNDFSFLLDIVDDLTVNLCNSVKGPGKLSEVYFTTFLPSENLLYFLSFPFFSDFFPQICSQILYTLDLRLVFTLQMFHNDYLVMYLTG